LTNSQLHQEEQDLAELLKLDRLDEGPPDGVA